MKIFLELWENHKEGMSEDILYNLKRNDPSIAYNTTIFNEALIIIEDTCISINNKSLRDLSLPSPNRCLKFTQNSDYMRETSYNIEDLTEYLSKNVPLMNQNQKTVYNTIMEQISNEKCGIYFLDAPGGTGKTFLINLILAEIRKKKVLLWL